MKEFNLSEKIQTLEGLFNEFLRKWTGDNYPHLIDSDENDGEEFRNKLWEVNKEFIKLLKEIDFRAKYIDDADLQNKFQKEICEKIDKLAGNKLV